MKIPFKGAHAQFRHPSPRKRSPDVTVVNFDELDSIGNAPLMGGRYSIPAMLNPMRTLPISWPCPGQPKAGKSAPKT